MTISFYIAGVCKKEAVHTTVHTGKCQKSKYKYNGLRTTDGAFVALQSNFKSSWNSTVYIHLHTKVSE